jgi:dUTPase
MTFLDIIPSLPQIVKTKLEDLKQMRERPDFHPEPSAFVHTQIVTDRLIPTGDKDLIATGIFHDICKFDTMKINPKTGFPTSPGHELAAVKLIDSNKDIQDWIIGFGADLDNVKTLVENHMRIHQLDVMRPFKRDKFISTIAAQGIFDKLVLFGKADNMLKSFNF